MRLSTGLFHAKNAALLLLTWVGSAWAYGALPETMPGHFGLLGQVSYYTETTALRWFMLPGVALILAMTMYGIAALVARFPQHMNLPDPHAFEQLTPKRRAIVIQLMQDVMYGITALLLLMLAVLQLGIYSVALNGADLLPIYTRVVLWVSLPLLILIGPVVVWLLHDTTQRLYREQMG